jgi:Sulfotransferase family
MSSFKRMQAFTDAERHFSDFKKIDSNDSNVLLKRRIDTHRSLSDMEPDIILIYAVRHPFDTLTSYHPAFPHRRFYVSEKRWRSEYAALKELRAKQPARTITYVRYCDLVTSPDEVQRQLAKSLRLEIDHPFSQTGVKFSTSSIRKYEENAKLQSYLWLLPHGLREELKQFCDEFGYELPVGYVRPPSIIGDAIRRILVPIKARKWPIALRVGLSPIVKTFKQGLRPARRLLSRLLRRSSREGTGAHPPER